MALFFYDSLHLYEYSPDLDMYVSSQEKFKCRSEGNGTTHIGRYGINGVPDITAVNLPKIAIWGDSHSEAWQVDDKNKMAQMFTQLCNKNKTSLMAFSIGLSGNNTADHYFAIPKYEKLIPNIQRHVILLTALRDILPDPDNGQRSVFLSQPEYRFSDKNWCPKFISIKPWFEKFKLGFVWNLLRGLQSMDPDFHPKTGTANLIKTTPPVQYDHSSAWEFLLSKLKQQTKKPITFVYCPRIPRIANNHVTIKDENKNLIKLFKNKCQAQQIGLIDMTDPFIEKFKKTQIIPYGFSNTNISEGHLNMTGHRLIAEKLFSYCRTDALHTN